MAASPSADLPTVCDDMLISRSPGIAFEVEISDCSVSPLSVPKRVRQRLLDTAENKNRSPASLQDIEAKLKEADVRRQHFHEWLANKARPKARSPPRLQQSDDLAERLQAKLSAAEQKRLDLLAQEQTRLARSHEQREAARTEVHLRAEREREELESKVESRVQQAETNRLALLESEKQRRALVHERVAQSIMQRMTQEGKDRERVEALRALICQKIAAADEKRASRLRAERTRAQALVLQARRVAKAVRRKRELELRKRKELLEARLQKAKRRRAEYLGQRGGCQGACHNNGHKMKQDGDRLCRKLTRCWRQFRHSRRTTLMLVQEFAACNINVQSVSSLPFEELASRITSSTSLRSVKAVLARLESRFLLSSASNSNVAKIDHLLRRLSPPSKKTAAGNGIKNTQRNRVRGCSKVSGEENVKSQKIAGTAKGKDSQRREDKDMDRYPSRVFLCAYMILGHPEAVFSTQGDREGALSEAAWKLVSEFETLVSTILDGPPSSLQTVPSSPSCASEKKMVWDMENCSTRPFTVQLAQFDAAWCSYLYQFVAWKVQDAQLLEEDLIRVACQLELSMLQKCNFGSDSAGAGASHDAQAIQKQVLDDQRLLRERVLHLTGAAGVARIDAALAETRNSFLEAQERGSPPRSPFASPQKPRSFSSSSFPSRELLDLNAKDETPGPVVAKSLLNSFNKEKEMETTFSQGPIFVSQSESIMTHDEKGRDNERLVNEMLHEPNWSIVELGNGASKTSGKLEKIQAQIKTTIEDAFWNGLLEGLAKDPPEYGWIIRLLKEARTELETLVPDSWKDELKESFDVDIFSQVLESGNHDYDYFRKLLDYALSIVLKLGAPARDSDARVAHELLVAELSEIASQMGNRVSFALALVKGLRFVLEQIQVLKADISVARIQALAPVVQGSAGVQYLQTIFATRYELSVSSSSEPIDYVMKLPKTVEWLNEVRRGLDQDRDEFEAMRTAYWSSLPPNQASGGPLATMSMMRTGGRVVAGTFTTAGSRGTLMTSSGSEEQRVLQWRSTSTFVGLGMLHIVCELQAMTEDTVAETLRLNVHRLRKGQNDFQRIIIMATGLLLLRQNAAGRGVSGAQLDDILSNGREQLESILNDSAVSISQIGVLLAKVSCHSHESDSDLATNSELMTRVLGRSLSPDDAVFKRVSTAVQTGLRAIILLGNGTEGYALANLALQRIGATCLQNLVVELGNYLERLSSVTCSVHGAWYNCIINSD